MTSVCLKCWPFVEGIGSIMEAWQESRITDLLSSGFKTLMTSSHINASLTDDGKAIITHNYVNLAMAVGMDNGLMTDCL